MSNADEIANLKRELAELKDALKPPAPPKPFVPDDWQPPNPLDRIGMSPQTMRDLALPDDLVRGVVRDNRAPQTPSIAGVPSSQTLSNVRTGGNRTGWQTPMPLSNPPGIGYADRLMDEADRRDRIELAERLAKQNAMQKVAEPK